MRKADLFDEIIFRLRESAATEQTTRIDPELLLALMSDAPARQETAPAPVVEKPVPPRKKVPAAAPAAVPAVPVYTPGQPEPQPRSGSLQELFEIVSRCDKCPLCATRTNVVFGDGNPHAELMFIGEGPGANEDATGLPFVGRAGELLTRMIAAMDFDREKDVYIANIVKCRPPENRTPEEQEARTCLPYLEQQIEMVKPKVLVLLGATPLLYLLNMRGISHLHGQWFEYKGIKTLATYHPAYLLRRPDLKADAWKDLQVVMRYFGKTPGKKTNG